MEDLNLKVITHITKEILGRLFGDKECISNALSAILLRGGIPISRNMKQVALSNDERLLLRKRSVIETVNDPLKNIRYAEHTRFRSFSGLPLNLLGALAAYSFFEMKPSITPSVKKTGPSVMGTDDMQLLLAHHPKLRFSIIYQ